ncbi:hypothetical protein [Herbaspirillum robiniae]|uniref:hypothetical protein n=1 Tax=Herbaspirillum robiniae TaxID=2014887 RepID=UPI003D7763F4
MRFEDKQEIAKQLRQNFFEKVVAGDALYVDGVMSPQTIMLVEEFSASGVDMTAAWSWTPMDWVCPACGRCKADIVRLNSKQQLMCRLVEHHDHMKDLLETEFVAACKASEKIVADEFGKRFAARASQMVAAYDNAIICDDCNTADAKAKDAVSADRNFSFSPGEIRKFVKQEKNRPHSIDVQIALEIWRGHVSTFALRLKIAKRIAEIAANNVHWYQELPLEQRAEVIRARAASFSTVTFGKEWIYELTGDPRVQEGIFRRGKQQAPTEYPSDKDVEYVARVTSSKHWLAVPEEWKCPVCRRSKNATVRQSKAGWIFLLSEPGFFGTPEWRRGGREKICGECSSLAVEIGKEGVLRAGSNGSSNYAQYVTAEELKQVLIPQAHGRHNVNSTKLDEIMLTMVERIRMMDDKSRKLKD